jgi:2',3'-cyclic-nucleotide 2'-phosphodiesterase (5'-nucleotidase family)
MIKEISKADIGLINSGSLRADLNSGAITREELINIYPFVDKYHVVEIDGSALKELLEYSYQLTYGFGQMSGITSKYDSDKPAGNRLIKAKVNGKPIDDSRKYTIACSSFLANGGDGFHMLKNGNLISRSEENLIDAYIDYIGQVKQLNIPDLGRQVDVAKK